MKSEEIAGSPINQSSSELCHKMMSYIDTHLSSLTSLNEMASDLGYNYSYLSALFKKTTTVSLSYYYRVKRLETARILITEKKMTMSRIAEVMNYSSIYVFSKSFRGHYGISPRQHLQQFQKAGNKK